MMLRNLSTTAKLLFGIVVAATVNLPGIAYSQDKSPWSVKVYGVFGAANESFGVDRANGGRVEAGGDAIFGAGAAVEYRLNDSIGIEGGAAYTKTPDVDYDTNGASTEVGEGPSFAPIHLGVNYHVYVNDKLDIHVGPRFAYVSFGDFDLDVDGQRLDYKADVKSNDFVLGASAGLSYQLGNGPVSLLADVTYYSLDMEVTEVGNNTTEVLDFDPLFAQLGIRYQF